MVNECKKGYDVEITKTAKGHNITFPLVIANSDGTSSIGCKMSKCELIESCEYKDEIKQMGK